MQPYAGGCAALDLRNDFVVGWLNLGTARTWEEKKQEMR